MVNSLVNRFVSNELSIFFKSMGFRKRGLRWHRRGEEKTDCVDVQIAKYGTEYSSAITLNFGVFFEEVWRVRWGAPQPKNPPAADCAVHFRIGAVNDGFIPLHADKWWELADDNLFDKQGEEIRRLSTGALERMSQIDDYGSAVGFIEKSFNLRMHNDRMIYLILKILAGDDSAKDELAKFEPFGEVARGALARVSKRGK